ncbi:MAG: glycosyltransferase family 2 protein, partial [Gemmatimonadales bacterium]
MELVFWLGFAGVAYSYFGYPLVLLVWGRLRPREVERDPGYLPRVSVVLPVHNEEKNLPGRLSNLQALDYPPERLEIFVVSDASTDATTEIVRKFQANDPRIHLIELEDRGGKAGGLNAGVAAAGGEVIVFTDAGIEVEPESLRALVAPLADSEVGCVSAEDRVEGGGGEALYGRYELFLRDRESRVASVVGASGSYYAQRRDLVPRFPDGIAPDFLSVLYAVDQGYRAISEPRARGRMGAVRSPSGEFRRKVRTLLRGMTGLVAYRHLLNPFRTGAFAFILASHKLARWLVPGFLVVMLVANVALAADPFYGLLLVLHVGFYLAGLGALAGAPGLRRLLAARIPAYFINVNAAIAVAWWRYLRGERMEV